ncbi:MAG: YwaF family protein, partial [Clostridia bacterium]|nr:YwaF family protein [Clostridia bacterium]
MNLFHRILNLLEATMETPTNFGWFHLMFVVIVILTTIFLCVKFRDCDDKIFRRIALISWIVIVALEIYKQIIFSYNYDNGVVTWDYQWYAFPYQFCSTPLFTLPFVIFLKDGKIRDAFILYMSTFSLFAGLAVFAYPNDVFIDTIGINIQTMVHHGLQIVFGIYFAVYSRKKYT